MTNFLPDEPVSVSITIKPERVAAHNRFLLSMAIVSATSFGRPFIVVISVSAKRLESFKYANRFNPLPVMETQILPFKSSVKNKRLSTGMIIFADWLNALPSGFINQTPELSLFTKISPFLKASKRVISLIGCPVCTDLNSLRRSFRPTNNLLPPQ